MQVETRSNCTRQAHMLIVVPAVGDICIVAIPDTVTNAIVMLGMSASTVMTNITINMRSIIVMIVNS